MSAMLLHKEKWSEFTGKLSGKNLWAPAVQGEMKKFARVAEGQTVHLDEDNTTVPPRRWSFPRRRHYAGFLWDRQTWSFLDSMKRWFYWECALVMPGRWRLWKNSSAGILKIPITWNGASALP